VGPDLFLAHRLRANRQVLDSHLPTECLVGSGWVLDDLGNSELSAPGPPGFTANRYLVARGSERQVVLFWFWANGRDFASENWADFYLTLDSLRTNRQDYFLVRINTPLQPGEAARNAQLRLFSFATQVNRLLDRYASR
jgi:EpsI family protein